MTVVLGWRSAVVASVLLIVLAISVTIVVRRASQRDILDHERTQEIEKLELDLAAARASAGKAHQDADDLREQREVSSGELDTVRTQLKALRKKPMTAAVAAEEHTLLLLTVPLLEAKLSLANRETIALRREIVFLKMSMDYQDKRYEIQSDRLHAAQRNQKRTRRRNIGANVGYAAGGLLVGFGLGRI